MEFLFAIGTAIVGKIAEYTVGPVVCQISYVTGCEGNLQQLDSAVEKLKAAKDSVANEVGEAERRGERIQPDVQLWRKKVDDITAKTDQFFQDERPAELKCFHGGLCGNLKIRHQISRKSTKLLSKVIEVLDEKGGFSTVSCGILQQEVIGVSTGDYQVFASRTSIIKEVMDELKHPNSKRIGVYGIGGVGKTTLVQQVYKQATEVEKNLFDDVVILLDVNENPDLVGIQKTIVEKLGMNILDNETTGGRANRLCARIKDKKTLVILDDVREKIKLEALGIPSVATCKILLTSRSRKALTDMNADKDFELCLLEDKDTWVLFENKAGVVVKDPAIRTIAMQIAEYCRGLPVLIVTVASTLKIRTSLPPWEDALRCLKESDSPDLTELAYSGLEWSYDKLNRKELQQLFLLCGIAIRGNEISLTDLLRYGMGLGFLGNLSTLKDARNKVISLVEELKDFCLLIQGDDGEYVRMHDLVRDVANRIALRNHILSSVVDGSVRELNEWSDKDFLQKCTIISLPYGNSISRLPKVLQCRALKMLLLQGDQHDDSLTIVPTFFNEMKQLKVLALERMCMSSLPSSFKSLKNVQTLCLERCDLGDITLVGELSNLEILSFVWSEIEQLPKEIARLTHLRLLDLSNCDGLEVISPGVISSLTRLEDLRVDTFENWEAEGEGRSNASLLELKNLSRLTSLQILIPDVNMLPADVFSRFELERYRIVIGCDSWPSSFGYDGTLNTLEIEGSIQLGKDLEMLLKKSHQLYSKNFDFTANIINRKVVFPKLMTLRVDECHGLTFLFSSSMARSLVELKDLVVMSCENMEEIVLSIRVEEGEEKMDNLFPKLQSLRLESLPKLVRFCRSSYIEFSSLEKLELADCYELESFICDPLNGGEKDREETALQYSLFNEKVVRCRNLEKLEIQGLRKLKTIWQNQLVAHQDSFCRLKDVGVSSCESLITMFPPSIMGRLNALKTIRIKECKSLEVVFEVMRGSIDEKVVRCRNLEKLEIQGLRKLKTIWQNQLVAHQDSFCRLKDVGVSSCESLINMFPPSIMGRLNALKTIRIKECKALEVVFEVMRGSIDDVEAETDAHVDTSSSRPFYCPNLDSVCISTCNSLQNIFPVAVARGLEQLCNLEVRLCQKLEGIIGEEAEGVIENPPHELVFPNVSSLKLMGLSQLKSFYTAGMRTSKWPSLKKLEVVSTSQVSFLFREKHDRMDPAEAIDRPLFLIQKDSFPQLEELASSGEIWYGDGPSPADFFPKLKSVCSYGWAPFSNQAALLFLDKLPNLEKIQVGGAKEIFVGEGSGEIHALPRVRFLTLCFMHELLHLGNQSAAASPVPNMQFLELVFCAGLNSLDHSSAIPFGNLTTLKVTGCNGLKYLISYSVAKSLVQLKTMQVEDCENIEVIIATDGDDDDDDAAGNHEIVYFNCTWKHVKLRKLPRLKGFSSPNCIVKFPSLETFKVSDGMDLKIDGVHVVQDSGFGLYNDNDT